jgi:hypothetical protein
MDQDWDNLVILDACRYDLFEIVNTLSGELQCVISRGSNTTEFLTKNFGNRAFPDTVYVTANPNVQYNSIDSRFHLTERLWQKYWDEELRTVPPEAVVDAARTSHENYPNKRLIVHFIQPHYPFIGDIGRNIQHGTFVGVNEEGNQLSERDHPAVWRRLERGSIDADLVWEAYRENLELTLPHIDKLLADLNGKTIVTSDHGNAFGEFGLYGHPGGKYVNSLVKVPWLVVEGDKRKTISADGFCEVPNIDEGDLDDKLADLGYIV